MSYPNTYSEWVSLLEKFSLCEDQCLDLMENGEFKVDSGTALRFYTRIEEVYKKRKQLWLSSFQRSFELFNLKSEDEFEITLRNGLRNLTILNRFVSMKSLPENLRNILKKDLEDFVKEINKSLKENVSKAESGREKMFFLLKSFNLESLNNKVEYQLENKSLNINESRPESGRKIIF